MDDHTIAHPNDSEPSTTDQDHSAPQLEQSYRHNSDWEFRSIDDDRRAAAHGFVTPEELLLVADNSGERHDNIKIVWTGTAGDPGSRSAIVGTASQHLQTMYELRNLLGLPMSFRGKVPSYPANTDIRVKQYWERKHGLQSLVRAVQAQATGQQELSPATPCPRLATQEASDPTVMEAYNAERTQVVLPPPAKPASSHSFSRAPEVLEKPSVPAYRLPERTAPLQNHDEATQRQESSSTTVESSAAASHARDIWSHSDLENMAKLPCIDCGDNNGHARDCNIGNLTFKEHLTMLDYRVLADIVEQFDPGPWTTHFNPYREPEPEDPRVQIAGMAEVIRNEDSYKNDPELHDLPDDLMIILWAFKTSDGVEVISFER